MSFSKRNRLELARKAQIGKMNNQLRNALWNVIYDSFFHKKTYYSSWYGGEYRRLFEKVYDEIFNLRIDDFAMLQEDVYELVRKRFFKFTWNQVYDFIEFIANNHPYDKFKKDCNKVLEREFSGYRFVNNQITQIINKEEIKEIETAINNSSDVVTIHLKKALTLMSDKKKPDYGNSIKESISALESLFKKIANNKKLTLNQALDILEKNGIKMPPSLKKGLSNLYGYASAEDGIRHGLFQQSKLNVAHARFFLILSSALVNY
jgi:hypothetical protein